MARRATRRVRRYATEQPDVHAGSGAALPRSAVTSRRGRARARRRKAWRATFLPERHHRLRHGAVERRCGHQAWRRRAGSWHRRAGRRSGAASVGRRVRKSARSAVEGLTGRGLPEWACRDATCGAGPWRGRAWGNRASRGGRWRAMWIAGPEALDLLHLQGPRRLVGDAGRPRAPGRRGLKACRRPRRRAPRSRDSGRVRLAAPEHLRGTTAAARASDASRRAAGPLVGDAGGKPGGGAHPSSLDALGRESPIYRGRVRRRASSGGAAVRA